MSAAAALAPAIVSSPLTMAAASLDSLLSSSLGNIPLWALLMHALYPSMWRPKPWLWSTKTCLNPLPHAYTFISSISLWQVTPLQPCWPPRWSQTREACSASGPLHVLPVLLSSSSLVHPYSLLTHFHLYWHDSGLMSLSLTTRCKGAISHPHGPLNMCYCFITVYTAIIQHMIHLFVYCLASFVLYPLVPRTVAGILLMFST